LRQKQGGVRHLSRMIDRDIEDRGINLSKPQREGLADIAASLLGCRTVNTSELAAMLPRKAKNDESRFRYIHRWLGNEKISCRDTMLGWIPELLTYLGSNRQQVVLMLDQTQINKEYSGLFVSLRLHDRAIPIVWTITKTQGAMGFIYQKPLLESLLPFIPEHTKILLMADRFYGTSRLISLCQSLGFEYRIRLKAGARLCQKRGEITGNDMLLLKTPFLKDMSLGNSNVMTSVGVIQDKGHDEPWVIAMSGKPSRAKTLDYGLRWGIESMFSDLKSRGFHLSTTQIQSPERLERLILVWSVAMMWAISTGWLANHPKPIKKKR